MTPTIAGLAHDNDILRARLLDLERRVAALETPTHPTFVIGDYKAATATLPEAK